MPELIPWFLFLHVLGAVIAFGPTFSFSIIGAMGAADRSHANFATRVSHAISTKRIVPFALSMPVTGIGLIWAAGIDPFTRDTRWLALGIVLWAVLITFGLTVQIPTTQRIVDMTSGPPPEMPAGSAPSGPPPALMALILKVQRGGMFLGVMVAVIVFLMVVKPDLGF